VATIYEGQHFLKGTEALFAGITGSVLFYMVVIVVEETVWAARIRFKVKG
jgi:hypothetical protein